MKEGIEAGDTCVNIMDHAHREERLRSLAGAGIDVAAAERSGQLELRPWEHAQLIDGHFDQHAMLAGLDAAAAGGPHKQGITRIWSNQEWALNDVLGCHDLVEYESRFNDIWPQYNDVFVCVYDTTKFSGDVLTNVLRAHPFAIVGGILRENPFYAPPRELLDELRRSSGDAPRKVHARFNDAEGSAALSVCESILLALNDLKVISEKDARDLLMDVATTHEQAAATSQSPGKHQDVVQIVNRMLAGKNGVRH